MRKILLMKEELRQIAKEYQMDVKETVRHKLIIRIHSLSEEEAV